MLVVSDTSVLISLCRINADNLLLALFDEVWIPPAVADEFIGLVAREYLFRGLAIPSWVKCSSAREVAAEVIACGPLDRGESEALTLAIHLHADLVLIDEIAGREAASRLGLKRTGIAGVLLRAKDEGLIPAVAPVLEDLRSEARFWINAVLEAEVLRLAGEGP